jgi:hypothetical protein
VLVISSFIIVIRWRDWRANHRDMFALILN